MTAPTTRAPPLENSYEGVHSILLRGSQVQLVRTFVDAVREGRSLCHQMLMGAGKTTVVGPLLALLLADGDSLVMSAVPTALLPMTLEVSRSRLGLLNQRPVHVFVISIDRHLDVEEPISLAHSVAGWRSYRPAPGGELPLMRSPWAGAGWCAREKGTASQGARLGRAW